MTNLLTLATQIEQATEDQQQDMLIAAWGAMLPFIIGEQAPSELFASQIAKFYADLAERQEPLGAEFEAVWDANVDALFEP